MDFVLPKLSATMDEATVLRWLKQPGDPVKLGEPIVELETDKAAMEIEAPVDGAIGAILAAEGSKVTVGGKLAEINQEGEAPAKSAEPPAAAAPPARPASVSPPPATSAAVPARSKAKPQRILASPLARRLASLNGVDLSTLTPGKSGRIRKADVLAAAEARAPAPVRAATPAESEALSPMRARVAETVSVSRRTIPSFTLDRFVSTEAIAAAKAELGPVIERQTGVRLTLSDFLLQALADSLAAQPTMLSRWAEGAGAAARLTSRSVDIGLIVALENGMVIPVVTDFAGRSLGEVALARRDAVQRARSGRLNAADNTPVAMALSNLSRAGADRFEAIIAPGQSSVLAVGREHENVVARGGAAVVVTGVHLTLSVDHRLIDGMTGATFLGVLADRLEFGPWRAD